MSETMFIMKKYNAQITTMLVTVTVFCFSASDTIYVRENYPAQHTDCSFVDSSDIEEYAVYEGTKSLDSVSIAISYTASMHRNLAKLEHFASLKENWNGYGAKPFSRKLLDTAEGIIRGLSRQPEIFPTADDSIQMEYEKVDGGYLEIQLTDSDLYDVFLMECEDSEGENFSIKADIKSINEQVRKFYASKQV